MLRNEKERRIKLTVEMPLSNTLVAGIPDEFAEEYALMEKQKSAANFKKISVILEGAQLKIFTTDTSKRSAVDISGVTIQDVKLVATGIEDKRTVQMEFMAHLPGSELLRDWAWDHLHMDFFTEVIPTQMSLEEEDQPPAAKGNGKGKKKGFDPKTIKKAAEQGELLQ